MASLFATTAFLGAFLLFCAQPMIAKMVLPQFGGSPAVWNTCTLFFQAALLAGYAYAHAATTGLDARRRTLLHLVVLLLPIAALPIAFPPETAAGGDPALRLLGRLLVAAGLPFFVVATTAPLLQGWFASTSHRRAGDPYFLYAASNAGSLLALVGYATLIEPNLALGDQARLWAVGYGIFAALLIACDVSHRRAFEAPAAPEPGEAIGALDRLAWVALAFAPSSLLLGVTAYLTTDLSPVPMLWVVPLSLYLLSFILAFAVSFPEWVRRVFAWTLPPATVATLALMLRPSWLPLWATFALHLATFFLAATACHAELARRRPVAGRLTEFYLMVSIGGALGGMFNALIAPVVFTWLAEYPLGLALAASLVLAAGGRAPRPASGPGRRLARPLDVALPLLLGGLTFAVPRIWGAAFPVWPMIVPLVACLFFAARPLRFALGLAGVVIVTADFHDSCQNVVLRERDFYGVLRVSANFPPGFNTLSHGRTIHGMQSRSPLPAERRLPLMYYYPTSPIGQVFHAYSSSRVLDRVGVVGLGVGSLASYGMPGQEFTFFEIDPAVERIARDPAFFHYLEDCRARWSVVPGDARMSLARERAGSFGLIVLDAFSGDAIPVHLLTREAMRVYLDRLAEGGLIALHVSNSYLDLEPLVRELASDAGLVGLNRDETGLTPDESRRWKMTSQWIVLARRQGDLAPLARRPGWLPLAGGRKASLWTDDHSDVFSLLRWR